MIEKILHGGNFAACFGALATTAADLGVLGGTATGISALLSGVAVIKKDASLKPLAEQMGEAFVEAVTASPLPDEAKRLIPQLMQKYPIREDDIAAGGLVAAKVADITRARIEANRQAEDPALTGAALLNAYEAILTQTLTPVLAAPAGVDPLQMAVYRELLARSESSGAADKLRDEGITEKAIVRLAQRIAADTEDVGQAWLELQNAMDIAVRVQKEGTTPSNHGGFVDVVLARVAELSREGEYASASEAIDEALKQAAAEQVRLLDSGVEVAMLARDAQKATALLVRKADLEAGGHAKHEALRLLWLHYHEIGRDKGSNLDSAVAIELARFVRARASTQDELGEAANDLANALIILGERDRSTSYLEEAISVLTEALKNTSRDRAPIYWGLTQMNLGIVFMRLGDRDSNAETLEKAISHFESALTSLDNDPELWSLVKLNLGAALRAAGTREDNTSRLEQAVAAYKEALEVRTRDALPLSWALIQMNLGIALKELGLRETGLGRLTEAVTAFNEALKERTRERVPLDWALTQMNLGTALQAIGQRHDGTDALDQAIAAFANALKENTRDRVPLDWAMIQGNLASVAMSYFDKDRDAEHLDRAETYVKAARRVFAEANASQYMAIADQQFAEIKARRNAL